MADIDSRPRKSVAFAEGETIVDSNGEISQQAAPEGEKDTAESHSKPDGAVEEATDDFAALALGAKKKKKKSKKEDDEGEAAEGDDGEVDLSALKKKKKKSKKPAVDDFEAKLAAAGGDEEKVLADDAAEKETAKAESGLQEGDLIQGTGIWAHDETKPINYESLLSRFFSMLADSHPDLGGGGMKSYKIPPPQCLREGNKKTIFANIAEICKRMKRTDEHVTQFLFAELGTSGSVDGSRRLVIKGRFQQKQIENVLRRYIGKCHLSRYLQLECLYSNYDHSRIRYLQDLPQPRHRAQQGREQTVLRYLQQLRFQTFRHCHQDWFLCPGWQEKENGQVDHSPSKQRPAVPFRCQVDNPEAPCPPIRVTLRQSATRDFCSSWIGQDIASYTAADFDGTLYAIQQVSGHQYLAATHQNAFLEHGVYGDTGMAEMPSNVLISQIAVHTPCNEQNILYAILSVRRKLFSFPRHSRAAAGGCFPNSKW